MAQQAATTARLAAYLDSMGVSTFARNTLTMDSLPPVDGLVIFPDGFHAHSIADFLRTMRHDKPALPIVVVTSQTQAYASAARHTMTAVLPRPVFSWGILDAVRKLCSQSASGPRNE